MNAWLFDHVLSVDPASGRLVRTPSRLPATVAGLVVGAIPASLVWLVVSRGYSMATGGMALTGVYALVSMALLIIPWLPSNRGWALDLPAKAFRLGANAPVPFESIVHRTFATTQESLRAEVGVALPDGTRVRLLYLANDGVEFAAAVTNAIAVSAVMIGALSLGVAGFYLCYYAA